MKNAIKSLFIFLICMLFSIEFAPINAFAYSQELNWYYMAKGRDIQPDGPAECKNFLNENNGYYVDNNNTEKVIYLTFDEGYENGNTSTILDILKEVDVSAAFFVTKPYIESQADLIKRMASEGHVVGNHSVHHPSMPSIHDPSLFKDEFTGVEESYKALTGEDIPKFFRPPMGKYSEESLKMTNELGYKTIFWSFAYRDWLVDDQPSHDYAMKKILSGAHPGEIMLLHAVSDTNTAILKDVIEKLQSDGYIFKSLNDFNGSDIDDSNLSSDSKSEKTTDPNSISGYVQDYEIDPHSNLDTKVINDIIDKVSIQNAANLIYIPVTLSSLLI